MRKSLGVEEGFQLIPLYRHVFRIYRFPPAGTWFSFTGFFVDLEAFNFNVLSLRSVRERDLLSTLSTGKAEFIPPLAGVPCLVFV